MSKPKSRWLYAHTRLKRLYEERVPEGMSQKEFGRLYEIGTQGFVAQLLNGDSPLNYELAAKFARGLRCTIYDICPEMDAAIRQDLVPHLGKHLRRVAAVLLTLLVYIPQDTQAKERFLHNDVSQYTMFVLRMRTILRKFLRTFAFRWLAAN